MRNIGFDQIAGGTVVDAGTLAEVINDGTDANRAALAQALGDLGEANPEPVVATQLQVDVGTKTATAVAGAATLDKNSGKVTSEALSTAAAAIYTLTLTNSQIAAADIVVPTVQLGTSTTGVPQVVDCKVTANTAVIRVKNIADTDPFNGTIVVGFVVFKDDAAG